MRDRYAEHSRFKLSKRAKQHRHQQIDALKKLTAKVRDRYAEHSRFKLSKRAKQHRHQLIDALKAMHGTDT